MSEKLKLGQLAEIVSGSTPRTNVKEYWDGNILWITPAEIQEDDYYILDIYNEKYPIICNNKDCTMKILKKYKNNIKDKYNVRRNEI